ncbi:MAG: hypothetical protein U5M51_10970 [Emticicia sp.]|nr:hypothetical protein [Emticicia sp.]
MLLTAAAEKAILTRIDQATEATDRWLPDAFATALTSHKSVLLKKHLRNLTMSKPAEATHDHSKMNHAMPAKTENNCKCVSHNSESHGEPFRPQNSELY